ncbi:MAG: TonB-dependent receptor [Sphingobium sp.]
MTPDPTAAVKTYTYSGTATLDTFFGAIKFIGGYRRIRSFSANDLEGSPFAVHQSTGVQRLSQASGELQITGKAFSDLIDFAAGAFYFHEKGVDASVRGTSIPTLNAITNEFSGSIDNDSSGLYGQANWHISDRLTFTGGLRYSVDDKGLTTRNTSFNRTTGILTCSVPTASVAAGCALTRNDDFAGVSYLAGLDYKIADDVLVYAKTSKGFRSGGQNLRANTVASALPFRPEIAYAYEGGIKSEFFDRRVRLNLAGYYSEINDIQRSTLVGFANGTTSTILSNAGKLRVYGLESDLAVRLFEGFEFGATGAVTNPKYLRYAEVPSRTNLTGDRRSERIENIPKYQFSLSANYDRDLGFARIALNADYSWTSAYALQSYVAFLGDPQGVTIDPFNGKTVSRNIIDATTSPKQGVLSARAALTFMDRQLEIAIYGRNLTNNRKRVSALYVAGINYVSETLREPRAYGMTATYRFGH